MGSCGSFLNTGGFKTTEWHALPETVGGVKVLVRNDETLEAALPYYSNTPATMYLQMKDSKFYQLRVYKDDRSPDFDIDFATHTHKEPYLHLHYFKEGKRQKNPTEIKPGDTIFEKYKHLFKGVV